MTTQTTGLIVASIIFSSLFIAMLVSDYLTQPRGTYPLLFLKGILTFLFFLLFRALLFR